MIFVDALVLLRVTHVMANQLISSFLRRAVMAEWLTHLTKDLGGTRFQSLRPPAINSYSWMSMLLWAFSLTCYGQRVEEKKITRNSQLFCLHYVNNQIIYTHAGIHSYHKFR